MKAIVKKQGNRPSVRIPSTMLEAAHLNVSDMDDVREESGRIVIVPIRRREYSLAELVEGITRRNRHSEAYSGAAATEEVW